MPDHQEVACRMRSSGKVFVWIACLAVSSCSIGGTSNSSTSGDGNSIGLQVLQDLSRTEMSALSDKRIELAELDFAVSVYIECVEELGAKAQLAGPIERGLSSVQVEAQLESDEEGDLLFERIEAGCDPEVDAIQQVWILQSQSDEVSQAELDSELMQCLLDVGAVPEDAELTLDQLGKRLAEMRPSLTAQQQEGILACESAYSQSAGPLPLPGLAEALDDLDTSGF